jgi:uridylate kinase
VLDADLCEIYTDVDGIYTTDPRMLPEARVILHCHSPYAVALSCLKDPTLLPLDVLLQNSRGAVRSKPMVSPWAKVCC